MSGHTCLNCGHTVTEKYCGNCGQKAETHRFDLKHFFEHDIVHGIFHLDKGFPFTVKQLFLRPGYAIREYTEGKRISYFNPVTFLLLLIAAYLFVVTATKYNYSDIVGVPEASNMLKQVQYIQQKYFKELYLITIPLASLSTFLIFRKARQNYAEHLVMNTYKDGGALLITTIFVLFSVFTHSPAVESTLLAVMSLLLNIYSIIFYWQYFSKDYIGKGRLVANILLAMFLSSILSTLTIFVILVQILGVDWFTVVAPK